MSRILVTGSNGFIGSKLVEALKFRGEEVFTIDILENRESENHFQVNIASKNLPSIIAEISPDVLVHLAAQVDVQSSIADPFLDLESNALGTLNVVSSAISSNCKNIVYSHSGGAVYDSNSELPLTEKSPLLPVSPYGLTKNIGEGYLRVLSELSQVQWSSLALSNVYGSVHANQKGVIFEFWRDLETGAIPKINGKNVTRDFIYIDDVIIAIMKAIDTPINARVNISSGVETTLLELYDIVARTLESQVKPIIGAQIPGDIARSCLGNTLAKELLKWTPNTTIEEGIRLSLEK